MASKKNPGERIFIKVMWGDADLGEISKKFPTFGSVTVGKGLFSNLKTKIWPLREDLTILERESGHIFLNSAIPWHGIISTGDQVDILDPRKRRRKILEIKQNTNASLRYEDITIAIRVGKAHTPTGTYNKIASKFTGSVLGLIADTKIEKLGLGIAIAASIILTLSVYFGLNSRSVWRPTSESEISYNLRIPFVSPEHFSTAPSVLQDQLDRFNYVDSVVNFYSELSSVLVSNSHDRSTNMISSEVKDSYKKAFEKQREQLHRFDESNIKLEKEITSRGGKLLSLPAIQGESLNGSMQRVLDKISILESTAKDLTDTRVSAGESFQKEASYDYTDKAGAPADTLADFTKKLGEGFRSVLPDEEQQLAESKGFAIEVSAAQIALFGKDHLISGVHNCCDGLVGVVPGVTPVRYGKLEDFKNSDQTMAALKASMWDSPIPLSLKPQIKEPFTGVIDEIAVEKSIAKGRFQLQLCFELALRRNQSAKGTMEWKWNIDTRGQLSQLSLVNSTLTDYELIQCVRQKIATWKFPKPKGGSVVIRYPFEFSKDKG